MVVKAIAITTPLLGNTTMNKRYYFWGLNINQSTISAE